MPMLALRATTPVTCGDVTAVCWRRDDYHALQHRVLDGARLRNPDRALGRVVLAVEVVGVGEIAVVGHVEVVRAGPHEGAHHGLGEEETVRVARLDRCELDVGRDADDADAVLRGSYRAR